MRHKQRSYKYRDAAAMAMTPDACQQLDELKSGMFLRVSNKTFRSSESSCVFFTDVICKAGEKEDQKKRDHIHQPQGSETVGPQKIGLSLVMFIAYRPNRLERWQSNVLRSLQTVYHSSGEGTKTMCQDEVLHMPSFCKGLVLLVER